MPKAERERIVKTAIMTGIVCCLSMFMLSCTTTEPSAPPMNGFFPLSAFGFPDTDDVVGTVDTSGVREIVMLLHLHSDLFDPETLQPIPLVTYCQATSTYHPDIDDTVTMGPVSINGHSIATARFRVLNSFVTPDFALPFGSRDIVLSRVSDAIIGSIDTALSYDLPVRFGTISRGDSISTERALNISVTNPGSGYVHVMMSIDTVLGSETSKSMSSAFWFAAGSHVTIPSSAMSQVARGTGTITISKFEPKIIGTSKGTKVAVVAETRHVVAVHFY